MTILENIVVLPKPGYPLDFESAMEKLYHSRGLERCGPLASALASRPSLSKYSTLISLHLRNWNSALGVPKFAGYKDFMPIKRNVAMLSKTNCTDRSSSIP